ncbi:hypothetical protein G9A89_022064 [Geosiphon pyriformis]|nr:hypothetical protein G9A89_022064 [Geosiphon pyriformis]
MDQLGCRVDRAASARIITADAKTPIGKINDFLFEVNGIVTSIKVLVMEATQYQALRETIDQTGEGERKAYQVSWMNEEHNELLPILSWDDNNKGKEKQKEELIWETDDLTWTDNDKSELTSSWEWKEDKENKGKGKEEETT